MAGNNNSHKTILHTFGADVVYPIMGPLSPPSPNGVWLITLKPPMVYSVATILKSFTSTTRLCFHRAIRKDNRRSIHQQREPIV